jgi:DNA-binding response OmpR family regulator
VPDLLVAADARWVYDEIDAAVGDDDTTLRWVRRGIDVLPAVRERTPDLAVIDLQIGNMGGMAVCLDLRLEESAGRLPRVPVLMLLDRQADVFLAKRSGAEGWIVKPLDAIRVRLAVTAILGGGAYAEGAERVLG